MNVFGAGLPDIHQFHTTGNDTSVAAKLVVEHLIGYDDIPLAEFASPPLTTVRSDTAGLGRDAMNMLLSLLHGETPGQIMHHEQPVEWVIRASCGAHLPGPPL